MKKVHVKMNKVLAAALSALLVCSSASTEHVFADTISSGESSGEMSDSLNVNEPGDGADSNVLTPGADEKPTDGTDEKDPTTGTEGDKLTTGTDEKDPVTGTEGDEPTTGTDEKDPTTGTEGDKPTTGMDEKDPVTGTEGDEPTTGTDEKDPTTGTEGDKPTTGTDEKDPTTGTEGDKPTTGTDEKDPTTGTEGDKPTTGTDEKDPTTGTEGDKPTTGTDEKDPTTGTEGDKPTTGTDEKDPTTGTEGDKPTTGIEGDEPTTGIEGDEPATGTDEKDPTTGTEGDKPATGTDEKDPTNDTIINDSTNKTETNTYTADGAYIFRFDGETSTESSVLGLATATQWNKKGLSIGANKSVEVPIGEAVSTGTVVFDIELCPASSSTQSAVFKNSKGETLFAVCANPGTGKVCLSDVEAGSSLVDLGTYTKNSWCRVRTEFYLDDSADGVLKFAVFVSDYTASSYSENAFEWNIVGSATQEDLLKSSNGANGTVSGADGSEEHPFDLGSITISNKGSKGRWIGDIFLYGIKGISIATAPGTQTAGEDFVPGDAAVEVTYPDNSTDTLKLADMLQGVDYIIEGYDSETAAAASVPIKICYGGQKLETTVEVKEPEVIMTGIEVKTNPTKTTYKIGESFDSTGLVVQAVYSDGTKTDLDASAYDIDTPDMTTSGYKEITVTYKENDSFTDKFSIRIEKEGTETLPSQSFYYIDADDISDLDLTANEGVLAVAADDKGSNTTNKLQVKGGIVSKILDRPIDSGIVTFETVGYQNSAVFGIRVVDSKGNGLINYAQQTSGNLNMYKGVAVSGADNTLNLASKRKNKWVRVVTEIDLDASNAKGVLQFEMNVYYKDNYTDEEWKLEKTVTQKEAFLDYGVTSGCGTEGLNVFDIKELQFESQGTSYVDDVYFNDGNGISGIVTTTKTLQSMEITKPASKLEFVQGSELITAGLELTGTYLVEYSDNRPAETKTFKINKFEAEYDFSQIKDESVVTIKVTDNGKEFTVTYTVKVIAKPDSSYVTFRYTDEESAALVGFDGSKISVTSGDIGIDDNSNTSNKIKLDKGTSTLKLADALTSGTVHFETEFLTTATSGASLFMRLLNSEGYPMVDIGQYGSSNLNLYLDKNTTGDYAHRVGGLPVNQWARVELDIDLDKSKELGYLVFDAMVWTTEDYSSEEWEKFAEFDQNVYINGNGAVHNGNGSASTKATKFDVASIELQNAGGTNYYDNMFFEAISGNVSKVLTELKIVSPAQKTTYYVGDKANTKGLVLNGVYEYTFSDGSKKQTEARVMKFTASLDSSAANEKALVTISAGGKTVTYPVTVLPNGDLEGIKEYLVDYVNNVLVSLGEDGAVKVNKRQIRLPDRYENGEKLEWEVTSGTGELAENLLTVIPSEDGATEIVLQVTMYTTNEDGDEVVVKAEVPLAVPKDSKQVMDDSMTTEESIKNALSAMYARGLFEGQANLKDVDAIMADLDRDITTEEIAVILVKLFDIDATYADTKVDREDVADDAWYSRYVKAAFQLSVETKYSHEGKKNYGIGKGIGKNNIRYMVDRIVKIDQTTLPSDYADRMFE